MLEVLEIAEIAEFERIRYYDSCDGYLSCYNYYYLISIFLKFEIILNLTHGVLGFWGFGDK